MKLPDKKTMTRQERIEWLEAEKLKAEAKAQAEILNKRKKYSRKHTKAISNPPAKPTKKSRQELVDYAVKQTL